MRTALLDEQGVDELAGSNGTRSLDRLAEADELHRDAELGLDGEHDAALGASRRAWSARRR